MTTAPPAAGLVPAAERGRLDIHDRVVERIATQVARGVAGVVTVRGGTLGIGSRYPRAQAEVTAMSTRVRITIAATWPTSLAAVAGELRSAVRSELGRQTGLTVTRVDVLVDDVRAKGSVDDD